VGHVNLSLSSFIDSGSSFTAKLNKNGAIKFTEWEMQDRVTFLNYIMGGCEIGVHVAIDFTLSNGAVHDPRSLHYFNVSN
jgi:hypothetical protein